MAIGPDFEKKVIGEGSPQSESAPVEGSTLGQFGDGLRHIVANQNDQYSFEAVNGHEDWHQSLRYPQ